MPVSSLFLERPASNIRPAFSFFNNRSFYIFIGALLFNAASLWEYHLDRFEWRKLEMSGDIPTGVMDFTFSGKKVYTGMYKNATSKIDLFALDIESWTWKKMPSETSGGNVPPSGDFILQEYNGKLYLHRKGNPGEIGPGSKGLYEYDIEKNFWTKVQSKNEQPDLLGDQKCIKTENGMFLIGIHDNRAQIVKIDMSGDGKENSEGIVQETGGIKVFSDKLLFKGAFLEKDFSDVTFKVQGREFYGHKIILSTASQHFKNMFKSGMRESEDKEIAIDDVKASTFEALLSYIYNGEVDIKQEFAMDLYELTDKWIIKDLNKHCKEYIEKSFTLENVGKIAKRAEEIGSEELCEAACDFMVNYGSIPEENDLKDFPQFLLIKTICKMKQVCNRKDKRK